LIALGLIPHWSFQTVVKKPASVACGKIISLGKALEQVSKAHSAVRPGGLNLSDEIPKPSIARSYVGKVNTKQFFNE